jgi:hypothetical protein
MNPLQMLQRVITHAQDWAFLIAAAIGLLGLFRLGCRMARSDDGGTNFFGKMMGGGAAACLTLPISIGFDPALVGYLTGAISFTTFLLLGRRPRDAYPGGFNNYMNWLLGFPPERSKS